MGLRVQAADIIIEIQPALVATQGADLHHREAYKPIWLAVDLVQPDEREILRLLAAGRFQVSMRGFRYVSLDKVGIFRALLYGAAGAFVRVWRRRPGVAP